MHILLTNEDSPLLLDEHFPTLSAADVYSANADAANIAAHNFHPWPSELETIVLIL